MKAIARFITDDYEKNEDLGLKSESQAMNIVINILDTIIWYIIF